MPQEGEPNGSRIALSSDRRVITGQQVSSLAKANDIRAVRGATAATLLGRLPLCPRPGLGCRSRPAAASTRRPLPRLASCVALGHCPLRRAPPSRDVPEAGQIQGCPFCLQGRLGLSAQDPPARLSGVPGVPRALQQRHAASGWIFFLSAFFTVRLFK